MAVADVDVERLRLERMRTPTFNSAAVAAGNPEHTFRRIAFEHQPSYADAGLERAIDRFPFVPDDAARLDRDCYEAFNIQVQGLTKRLQVTNGERVVIGVSGGLDSTHALIVAAKAFDALGLPRKNILGFTMPGFATTAGTKSNAWALMNALAITGEEIDIKPAAECHTNPRGHDAPLWKVVGINDRQFAVVVHQMMRGRVTVDSAHAAAKVFLNLIPDDTISRVLRSQTGNAHASRQLSPGRLRRTEPYALWCLKHTIIARRS